MSSFFRKQTGRHTASSLLDKLRQPLSKTSIQATSIVSFFNYDNFSTYRVHHLKEALTTLPLKVREWKFAIAMGESFTESTFF